MKFKSILILSIIIYLLFPVVISAEPISIDQELKSLPIGKNIEYFIDKNNSFNINTIKSEDDTGKIIWEQSLNDKLSRGFSKEICWVKFTIQNTSEKDINLYLLQEYPSIDYVSLFIPEDKKNFKEIKTGDRHLFSDRPYRYRSYIFPITLSSEQSKTFYMRFKTSGSLDVILSLWEPFAFDDFKLVEYSVLWSIYSILIALILYNLFIFIFTRDISYLYYILFNTTMLLWFMALNGTAYQYLWPGFPWWANFSILVMQGLALFAGVQFARFFINIKKTTQLADRILKYCAYSGLIHAASSVIFNNYNFSITIGTIMTSVIPLYGLIIVIYFSFFAKKEEISRQARFFLVAWLFFILGLVLLMFKTFNIVPATFFTTYAIYFACAAQAILLSLGLADRINIMRKNLKVLNIDLEINKNELLDLNENLEIKVGERTEELQSAMEEVRAMNDMLVETNENLEEAHRIAQLDMNMAANVQASLFTGEAPKIRNWDIALIFEPMSGVSGDMYDFYLKDDSLEGLALFDVSGHGISSGLITMIARSVFFRNFHKDKDDALNCILERANKDLIDEIGSTDKYLTGILLRFHENSIEYVNAAHPDLLCRSSATGKANAINSEDKNFKGMFIGIEGFLGHYRTLKYETNVGDILLLYSDCIYESRNSMGEEYGLDRVKESVEKAPDGSARQMLDFIVKDFKDFVGGDNLKDDFTVIVLKKTA